MKGNSLRADSAALATVRTSSGYMEGTNHMEHLFLKGIHICLLGAVEFVAVKNALKHQFALMTLPTVDGPTLTNNSSALVDTKGQPTIQVRNIQMQTYRLRGLLTEIRMVMSAEVTYQFQQNGAPKIVKNTIQVQRSYQYDQANVATDNPQAEQIKVWLYDNIAQRVAEQYLALAVPTTLPAKLPTP